MQRNHVQLVKIQRNCIFWENKYIFPEKSRAVQVFTGARISYTRPSVLKTYHRINLTPTEHANLKGVSRGKSLGTRLELWWGNHFEGMGQVAPLAIHYRWL
jgi:hypothetical protein